MQDGAVRYWMWAAYSDSERLVYGCLVCGVEDWASIPGGASRREIDCDGTTVHIAQTLLEAAEAEPIVRSLREKRSLNLSLVSGPSHIEVHEGRHRLLDALGRQGRTTDTYAATQFPEITEKGWGVLLSCIRSDTGVDHRDVSDRLNAFDVFDEFNCNYSWPVVVFEAQSDDPSRRDDFPNRFTLRLFRTIAEAHHVHVELQRDGDPVYSQLINLDGSADREEAAPPFDTYNLTVFDASGKLVQKEYFPLLLKIGLNISSVESETVIDDDLSRAAEGLGGEVRSRASTVRARSTQRSMVGVRDVGFDVHKTQMYSFMQGIVPRAGSDRWFDRGVTHEVGVIAHLDKLLDGGRVKSVVIVDPFFGAYALKRIIPRLQSIDLRITVVTSLGQSDPDTGNGQTYAIDGLRDTLRNFRESQLPALVRHLRVINLVDGHQQAFHDRYLLIEPHDGDREVYLLSNSFNRMAGRWPFCMSRLDVGTARAVERYIDGLTQGIDISGSTKPTVNLNWPDDER